MTPIYTLLENNYALFFVGGLFGLFTGILFSYIWHKKSLLSSQKIHSLINEQQTQEINRLKVTEVEAKDQFQQISKSVLDHTNQNFIKLAKGILENNLIANQKNSETTLSLQNRTLNKFSSNIEERIKLFDEHIRELEVSRAGAYQGMLQQIENLSQQNLNLSYETKNLSSAFKSNNIRGRWGELQLKRVCEVSGMIEHCDFDTQATISTTDQTAKLRPDMIINLPQDKYIIVDSKAPLEAYLKLYNMPPETDEYKKILKEHGQAVKKHINALSTKSYQKHVKGSAEFVVMFLPGEGIFSSALQADPNLIEYALEKNVLLTAPTTLIALLRSAAFGWQQTNISKNANELIHIGKELSNHLVQFSSLLVEHSKALNKSNLTFNKLVDNVNKKLIPSSEKISQLSSASNQSNNFENIQKVDLPLKNLNNSTQIRPKDTESVS